MSLQEDTDTLSKPSKAIEMIQPIRSEHAESITKQPMRSEMEMKHPMTSELAVCYRNLVQVVLAPVPRNYTANEK